MDWSYNNNSHNTNTNTSTNNNSNYIVGWRLSSTSTITSVMNLFNVGSWQRWSGLARVSSITDDLYRLTFDFNSLLSFS